MERGKPFDVGKVIAEPANLRRSSGIGRTRDIGTQGIVDSVEQLFLAADTSTWSIQHVLEHRGSSNHRQAAAARRRGTQGGPAAARKELHKKLAQLREFTKGRALV